MMRKRSAIYTILSCAFLPAQVGFAATASPWFVEPRAASISQAPAPTVYPDGNGAAASTARLPDEWTRESLRLVVKYQLNPLRAARVLAYVHAAIDDAFARGAREGMDRAVRAMAAHRAASVVLGYLFPQEPDERLEARGFADILREARAGGASRDDVTKAWLAGNSVAASAIARARTDGADASWDPTRRPQAAAHIWRAAPPLYASNPAEPLAGEWKTWGLRDGSEAVPEEPRKFDSPAYRQDLEEVRDVSRSLTPEQKRIAEEWNLDLGTVTPAGVWNRIALEAAKSRSMDDASTARMLAVLNAAMADAFIACWHAKYTWWTVRPVSLIRERLDPSFLPLIVTPSFPSYPSGHATVSGAASTVLGHFIPAEAARFSAMADEAALSRLYGGIHFRHDNDAGLALGRRVAQIVIERHDAGR